MRQLAYVGDDGQIRVVDLDLGGETEISARGRSSPEPAIVCNWPTWSPGGDRLAFFEYELAGTEVRRAVIRVAAPDGSTVAALYRLPRGGPVYMCWSPDGERMAVLIQEANELYLRVIDSQGQAITVAQGAPLYFVWQPDSRGVLVHAGGGSPGSDRARLVWVRMEGGQAIQSPVDRPPARDFRAPAWSKRRDSATFACALEDGAEIMVQHGPGEPLDTLTSTGPAPVFVWSPDGNRLAFAARSASHGGAYAGLSVYDVEDRSVSRVSDDPFLAFFWCPDGRRIVYTGGEMGGRMVKIQLIDTATGERTDLGWVRPSRDVMLLLGHFDQYSQSAHLFSPDGDELVLAASIAQELKNGSVPTVREIIVRPVTGDGTFQVKRHGRLAFWRPAGRAS